MVALLLNHDWSICLLTMFHCLRFFVCHGLHAALSTSLHVVYRTLKAIDRVIHSKYRSASHTRSYTFIYMYIRKYISTNLEYEWLGLINL